MKKVNHDHVCICGKPATHCLQTTIEDFAIDKDGDMELIESTPTDDLCEYFCDECYKKQFE